MPENAARYHTLRTVAYTLGAFLLFLFALDLMITSLQHLGQPVAETILLATANPFTGLFIGLLVTAMLQSSSTTTSLTVALVASGAITLQSAIPIIMGANVGTTITSTLVSLSFINKRKEFRRAVAAGTFHDFFNILTVVVLFPLEYYYGFLSNLSQFVTAQIMPAQSEVTTGSSHSLWPLFGYVTNGLLAMVPNAFVLTVVAVILLFTSVLVFRRLISDLLEARSPEAFSRFFFKSPLKSFGWGVVTTAAIRSSTVTTSVVVPIVAKKVASLRQAAPFIMGANVGTTVTAFIAALMNSGTSVAVSIAVAHFLFNLIGVCLFLLVPGLREVPLRLASELGRLTLRFRLAGFVYLLMTFFFIPFSLIYFNQDTYQRQRYVYQKSSPSGTNRFRMEQRLNVRTQRGEWVYFNQEGAQQEPLLIYPTEWQAGRLKVGKDYFAFEMPGYCWTGNNERGTYRACVEKIIPHWKTGSHTFDSVYVWILHYPNSDSTMQRVFMTAGQQKILLRRETYQRGDSLALETEELIP